MKKIILTLVFVASFTTLSAQTETENEVVKTGYNKENFNKWSVELSGGFNKPQKPLSPGHATDLVSPFTVDLGVRYMFNNKFGLKLDAGYNSITASTKSVDFDTKLYRVGIQGVANFGRILNFENWTKTIGLLGHTGLGVGQLSDDNSNLEEKLGYFIVGITGQIKLSNKFVLTGDMTTMINSRQGYTFDMASNNPESGYSAMLFTGTVGVTYYLGKNTKHADWIVDNEGRFEALEAKIIELEAKMQDADKDGVADYLDEESITPLNTVVDTRGRSLDKNNNDVPDATEAYILKNYGDPNVKSPLLTNNEMITNLINGGYVAAYFDFNKSTPTNSSTGGTDFVLSYLKNNPTASVDIIGNADEIGKTEYNEKLSDARANSVKDTLVKAGIDASRLNIIAAGEDKSVDATSEEARKLVRRVTFKIK